jgi:hypothetical protein
MLVFWLPKRICEILTSRVIVNLIEKYCAVSTLHPAHRVTSHYRFNLQFNRLAAGQCLSLRVYFLTPLLTEDSPIPHCVGEMTPLSLLMVEGLVCAEVSI